MLERRPLSIRMEISLHLINLVNKRVTERNEKTTGELVLLLLWVGFTDKMVSVRYKFGVLGIPKFSIQVNYYKKMFSQLNAKVM